MRVHRPTLRRLRALLLPLSVSLLLAPTACDDDTASSGEFDHRSDFEPIGLPPPDAAIPPRDARPPDPDDGIPPPDAGVEVRPLTLRFVPLTQDSGALRITDLVFLPEPVGDFLVLDKDGEVVHMRLDGDQAHRLGSFTIEDTWSDSDAGLISVATDPLFTVNHFIYLGISINQRTNVIRRYTFDPTDYAATRASERLVIDITGDRAPRSWHNVGSIGFTREGHLWALFGDKVLGEPAQDVGSPLGALLRISPDHDEDGGYDIPADNPYADGSGHPAVWAKGMRSPWKGFYDPADGDFWFGDVGLDAFEELNRVSAPRLNFGWPDVEGPCAEACDDFEAPWLSYGRSSSHAFVQGDPQATTSRLRSIWVGGRHLAQPGVADPYEGRWSGVVVFGDSWSGFVRATPVDGAGESFPVGHLHAATAMRQAPDGYVYATALGTWPVEAPVVASPIYRVELAD